MITVVTAQCVACKKKREVRSDDPIAKKQPMCEVCYMPMVATKVKQVRK